MADNVSNNVSVIDTAANAVVATVPVGTAPLDVAITPDGTHAYVTNFASNNVSVINTTTDTVIATVPTGAGSRPVGVAVARIIEVTPRLPSRPLPRIRTDVAQTMGGEIRPAQIATRMGRRVEQWQAPHWRIVSDNGWTSRSITQR